MCAEHCTVQYPHKHTEKYRELCFSVTLLRLAFKIDLHTVTYHVREPWKTASMALEARKNVI